MVDPAALAPRWRGLSLSTERVDDAEVRLLRADEAGPGLPHLLVHGLGASALSWADVARPIAERGPVVAPDLTGFGLSEPPRGARVTVETAVHGVVALLDHLGWDRAVLHGNSLGGFLVAEVAARHPERVAGMVLASPALPLSATRALPLPPALVLGIGALAVPGLGEGLLALAARRDEDPMTANDAMLAATFAEPDRLLAPEYADLYADEVAMFAAPWRRRALLSMTRSVLAATVRPGAWRSWRDAVAPTVLLWGEQDRLLPRSMLESARRHRPDWDVRELPGVAHVPQFDDPDAYLEAVDDVLVAVLGTSLEQAG